MLRRWIIVTLAALTFIGIGAQDRSESSDNQKKRDFVVAPSYAWSLIPPLGLHREATIDTLLVDYYQVAVPSAVSAAFATTGNIAAPGRQMIFMERKPMSDFWFRDALRPWLPSLETLRFYNTRIPMTLLSYNFGGGSDAGQDRLKATFSGNASKAWQVGAMVDYIHSKGSYDRQAAKDLTWGASASYMGDRYEMQAFMYHFNNLDMDNGGITDPLYITDPAELQGGQSKINPKSIPVNLTSARTRLKGTQVYLNNRYKVGFWREEAPKDSLDTIVRRTYVPVTSFIYTLDWREGKHSFTNKSQERDFWKHTYLSNSGTDDLTTYWSLRNTLGVSLLEGFNKWAKFGLSAYATYEIRRYNQTQFALPDNTEESGLDPLPFSLDGFRPKATENMITIGAQLTKQHGRIITYEATGELGVAGAIAGDLDANGSITGRIPLFGDTVSVTGYGAFSNREAPYLMKHYISNHFAWENDFGKERRVRFGGRLTVPLTGSTVDVGVENLQNLIYFGPDCLPRQEGGNVQVFSASLNQHLGVGVLNWDNRLTYQTSTNNAVIPLPKFAVYSNLYLLFRIAKVLHVQFGIDCDYYTSYTSVGYQPATMAFYNQQETKVGNYPFMNVYLNMKLSKARFYIMLSHANQGLTGKNYFSMPLYPLNPRRLMMGVSVDFAN